MSKIYTGTSAFFANRDGNHNWLDNTNRPMISLCRTDAKGKRSYQDLFLNKTAAAVKVNKDTVTITFRKNVSAPLFRILDKE
jgi:hypothetical protein